MGSIIPNRDIRATMHMSCPKKQYPPSYKHIISDFPFFQVIQTNRHP